MDKLTVIDIQHKSFKKVLTGYAPAEVDQFLDEIIETLEDESSHRSALEAEVADLKDRISHFKSMEESLRNTLLLAQRTADEVKASAHKEADLIKGQARLSAEQEIAGFRERADNARRETHQYQESTERAKSELRSFLMTHLALLDRKVPAGASDPAPPTGATAAPAPKAAAAAQTPTAPPPAAATSAPPAASKPAATVAPPPATPPKEAARAVVASPASLNGSQPPLADLL